MTFLHAGLLGLGALFTVPLLIHLLNRRRYQRMQWAAMDFLLKAFRQNRRRLRVESLLLLLLRCAIPILLALAVSRPRLDSALPLSAASQGSHHVFVLDLSYSMGYSDPAGRPFDRAKQLISAMLDSIAARTNEKVSLVLLGAEVTTPVRGDLDTARARRALAGLDGPGHGRVSLPPALLEAIELAKAEPEDAHVYVFSDFQKLMIVTAQDGGNDPDPTEASVQPKPAAEPEDLRHSLQSVRDLCGDLCDMNARVVFFPLAPAGATPNSQVVALQLDPQNVVTRVPTTMRAEVIHRGPEAIDKVVTLAVDGGDEQRQQVHLKPDQRTKVAFAVRFLDPGVHQLEVKVEEDSLALDDTRRLVTRVRDRIRVLLVEGRETATQEGILQNSYLYRYLLDPTSGTGTDLLKLFEVKVVEEDRFAASWLTDQDVVALLDVSAPLEEAAGALLRFVERGGGLLLAPGPSALPDLYNARFYGTTDQRGPMPLRLVGMAGFRGVLGKGKDAQLPTRYATPRLVAAAHPLVQDFRVDELRDFLELVPIFRYWGTTRAAENDGTQGVIELVGGDDEGAALVATQRYGQGECALLTSSLSLRPDRWNRLDSFDQISFPLVHSLFHHLAREPKESLNRLVGEPLTAWLLHEPSHLVMQRPDGNKQPLTKPEPTLAKGGKGLLGWATAPFENTARAGFYELATVFVDKTKPARQLKFAVNPDPAEGVLDYVRAATLARELPQVEVTERIDFEADEVSQQGSELGRTLLLLALACAVAECLLAGFLGRRRR